MVKGEDLLSGAAIRIFNELRSLTSICFPKLGLRKIKKTALIKIVSRDSIKYQEFYKLFDALTMIGCTVQLDCFLLQRFYVALAVK